MANRRVELDHSFRSDPMGGVYPGKPLSERQVQVLTLVAQGKSQKQVAHCLGISVQTVKNHMSSILICLEAWNAPHAVYLYFVAGKGRV